MEILNLILQYLVTLNGDDLLYGLCLAIVATPFCYMIIFISTFVEIRKNDN